MDYLQLIKNSLFIKNSLSVYPILEQHSGNVAILTGKVMSLLKLANREEIVFAAYLHDIGKATWPMELFSKYPLQPYDWSLIKAHPLAGENLLLEFWPDAPQEIRSIVRGHHERPGGTGYPDGLEEPSLEMLIVASCDAFDAITRNKEYLTGEALPREFALDQVARFAPEQVVNALEEVTKIFKRF
ncbi:MAG TPA: HD domain-containing protein [Bacillota bacterium]|nr:HD domain-containing protein [Bacillota bacterium]